MIVIQPRVESTSGEPELFGTETMAELYARQGQLADAIAIYRRLIGGKPDDERLARWTQRCQSLERAQSKAGGVALTPAPLPRAAPASASTIAPASAPTSLDSITDDITDVSAPAPVDTTMVVSAAPVHKLPMVVTQPVRSGQVVYAKDNDLIVLAPVNPGGQVVADGNVHIYAALRGRAVAGAQGANEARIFCQRLEAELLAINGIYLVWEDLPPELRGRAAQMFLRDGQVVVAAI
jgi:septum formation inhibitor MinC